MAPASVSAPSSTVTAAGLIREWPPPRKKSAPPPAELPPHPAVAALPTSAAPDGARSWSRTRGTYTARSQERPTSCAQRRTCRATPSSESSTVFERAASSGPRWSVAAGPTSQSVPASVSAARMRALAVQSDNSFSAGGSRRCNSQATSPAAPAGGAAAKVVSASSGGKGGAAAAAAAAATRAASSPRASAASGGAPSKVAASAAAIRSGARAASGCTR
mmetsp:Transcript_16338/g.48421  ORF Transcript_16338/g.48421 Transcript_16338/m.48421 type:complete len:219 (-) Transcript_16338:952-1608(-)